MFHEYYLDTRLLPLPVFSQDRELGFDKKHEDFVKEGRLTKQTAAAIYVETTQLLWTPRNPHGVSVQVDRRLAAGRYVFSQWSRAVLQRNQDVEPVHVTHKPWTVQRHRNVVESFVRVMQWWEMVRGRPPFKNCGDDVYGLNLRVSEEPMFVPLNVTDVSRLETTGTSLAYLQNAALYMASRVAQSLELEPGGMSLSLNTYDASTPSAAPLLQGARLRDYLFLMTHLVEQDKTYDEPGRYLKAMPTPLYEPSLTIRERS